MIQTQAAAPPTANGRARTGRVAVVRWDPSDGLAEAIGIALQAIGQQPVFFPFDGAVPDEVDVVLTFAPYNRLLQIPQQLAQRPAGRRPAYIHWNTEGLPDLGLPWPAMRALGGLRSWIGRLSAAPAWARLLGPLDQRMQRFRFAGDYYYAHRRGWLPVLADSSAVYTRFHNQHGLPTEHVPWGSTRLWYEDLGLERDIDVLWMGKRSSTRRSRLIDQLKEDLTRRGLVFYIADDVERPFIFGRERTRFLNRAKITLNLTRTWYDDNLLRFAITAPNRTLNVSETLLPHCPQYVPGQHYVSAPRDQLADTIAYYVQHADEREHIVQNAYALSTETLTLRRSVAAVLALVHDAPARPEGASA